MTGFDPVAMLRVLADHNVRYVLIGGVAGIAYGSSSVTSDLDICHDRRVDNLDRLASALRAVDARLRGIDDDVPFVLDSRTLAAGDHFTFTTRHGDFDCIGTPAGTRGYDDLARSAREIDLGGIAVLVTALDDLVGMKQATGRPKDRAELEILGALRDERGE